MSSHLSIALYTKLDRVNDYEYNCARTVFHGGDVCEEAREAVQFVETAPQHALLLLYAVAC